MGKKKTSAQRGAKPSSTQEYSFERAGTVAKQFGLTSFAHPTARKNSTSDETAATAFGQFREFHREVSSGGGVRAIRGGNKEVSTRFLRASQLLALDNQFVVATVDGLDSKESGRGISLPTNLPGQLFHAIMCKLTFPDGECGTLHLLELAGKRKVERGRELEKKKWDQPYPQALLDKIECRPLVWLLTQYSILERDKMATLFAGTSMTLRRMEEYLGPRKSISDVRWPFMNVRDQNDLISYLVSGVAALVRWLGYSGLIITFDQIGEWWNKPSATKEFEQGLGAFIWAAIAPEYNRSCCRTEDGGVERVSCRHGSFLKHSGNENSKNAYPFTTASFANLGILYALSPTDLHLPRELQKFGPHDVVAVGH